MTDAAMFQMRRDTAVTPLLEVRGLQKRYSSRSFWRGSEHSVCALAGVDFDLREGETLAIAGESGSGKSTLALCIAQLEPADAGDVWFMGRQLNGLGGRLTWVRENIQLIFQDSVSALNPRLSVAEIVAEPMAIRRVETRKARQTRAIQCLELAGLGGQFLHRHPLELSGGQRQRVAIARALVLQPRLLILDEAFSGLDLLLQEQILKLLRELQGLLALSYLLITHDLGLVHAFADRVAILHEGKIVEQGAPNGLFSNPTNAATKALLSAVPKLSTRYAAGGEA